jgi:hypothetical protein
MKCREEGTKTIVHTPRKPRKTLTARRGIKLKHECFLIQKYVQEKWFVLNKITRHPLVSTEVVQMEYCPACEAELPDTASFCGCCGYPLEATIEINTVATTSLAKDLSTEPQPLEVSIPGSRISTLWRKVVGNLPMPVQRFITVVLTRARDPEPEGLPVRKTKDQEATVPQIIAWGWLPLLTLTNAIGLLSIAYASTRASNGATGVDMFVWFGLLVIFVPSTVRLISPVASRFERISLLCIVGICFYMVNVLLEGLGSALGFDTFLHVLTADDITRSAHLFTVNPLLPASPFYPGLEILTNALSSLSGLSIFSAGIIVLGVARLMMILSFCMIVEHITKSARTAGIATMLYMTNPHFLFFDAGFSYESLALPLATVMLFAAVRYEKLKQNHFGIPLAAWIVLIAVIVTHHMTGFVFVGLLILWAVAYGFQRPAHLHKSNPAKTALFGLFVSVAWTQLPGNPVVSYLSSYFGGAAEELVHVLTGMSRVRPLFVSYSGQPTPLWERGMTFAAVALIMLGLPLGLLCLWQRYRHDALAWMLGIASLFYPISHVFRFTNFGSEIPDRAAAFLFIPLACLLAIFIVQFWPTRWLSRRQTALITCALSVVFMGNVVLGAGPPSSWLPGPYLVGADARSVEPEGIQAALWAYEHLGPDNRIATDRTNQLLMSVYGGQYIVTSLEDKIDVSPVFFSSRLGPDELAILQRARVRYLIVDLRLSTALPSVGVYFEVGEPGSFHHTTPISRQALTKFSAIPQVNRVFDSGDIVIYDVGGLSNAPEKP